MPRGITKRRPITVTALLDAAVELFAEQGYGATSIPEICARAGLTKGAFYSNFANKDALFLALLDRSWERQGGDGSARPYPGAMCLASESCGTGLRFPRLEVDREWTLVSMEFSLHAIRRPDVATLLVEHERRVRSELAVMVDRGARATPSGVPTIPVDELARMIVAVTEGSDIQMLTGAAAGASAARRPQGPRAVDSAAPATSRCRPNR